MTALTLGKPVRLTMRHREAAVAAGAFVVFCAAVLARHTALLEPDDLAGADDAGRWISPGGWSKLRAVSPSLLEIAEAPGAYVTPRHPQVVEGDGWVFVPLAPDFAALQRVRVPADRLEAVRDEVRALAAEREIPEVGWFRSELAEPQDLGERLGLELRETLTVLALRQAPGAEAAHEIREVTTFDDYVTAQQIDAAANGWPTAERHEYEAMWQVSLERFALWLAFDEGAPVGMARCAVAGSAFVMIGGSVLPEARGRGIYRSLVAARWASACARGLDALVTSANSQSGPILERLAFERLGEIDVWSDHL